MDGWREPSVHVFAHFSLCRFWHRSLADQNHSLLLCVRVRRGGWGYNKKNTKKATNSNIDGVFTKFLAMFFFIVIHL